MRIIILFLLVFLSACACALASGGEDIEEEQRPYFWDFGQVSQGEILEHAFVLRNDSGVILHIEDIRTSCGCTTSEVKDKEIPPGESAEIQVEFDTRGYSGIKKQHVYIHTDQQDNPLIRLTLKADIHPALSSE